MEYGKCYGFYNGNYFDKLTNKIINDEQIINKLNKVGIPKTYKNITICPDSRNDLVGLAVDGKNQVQYFYSDEHKREAARSKNCNLIAFGNAYPDILNDIYKTLELSNAEVLEKLDLNKLLHSLALRIMTLCHFRPGQSRHLRDNGTYGLTTMNWNHYSEGPNNSSKISFKGKKNQTNTCVIKDILTVDLLKKLNNEKSSQKANLLSYNGFNVTLKSLNDFLHQYHPSITTKTWRTWFANQSYIEKLSDIGILPDTQKERKTLSNQIIRSIAEELHHTLAVNKRNYLIPELEELFVKEPDSWVTLQMSTDDSRHFLLTFLEDYCGN
jgi:DNA topoisomerase IB